MISTHCLNTITYSIHNYEYNLTIIVVVVIFLIKRIVRVHTLKIKLILGSIVMNPKFRLIKLALGLETKTCPCFTVCPLWDLVGNA